jgi:UDP-N-acetylglucosamine--N-acetylmuramyl-(pentapeptide) pyrophosphoryl-undecaprenol N-acetylglucosamine transferase
MSASSKLACVIAAGGTAGHVRPALAVGEALRERGLTVTFAGTPDRVESRLVPEAGFPLDTFPVSGLPRKPSAAQIRAAWRASAAPAHCLQILARRRPDVVLGAGGYVAGPMVLAARLRRIPAALTEADAHLGLANRMAAPFARRLFLAYEIPGRNGAKVRVVGRPIPRAHLAGSRESGRALFGLPPEGLVVGVFGAYAGALSINTMAIEAWASSGPAVIHQAGARDLELVTSRVARDDYVVIEATDDVGELLRCVDLAVSRAGGTVWELAAAGTPAILVPYPYATADHQTLNARHFERGGGAIVVPDAEVDRVPALVDELLVAPERLTAMRQAMLALARPDAADVVADELVALARGGR